MKARLALVAALLGGCTTVGPDYRQADVPVPERFAQSDVQEGLSDAELAGWWALFGDLMLDELVNRAIALNLDVHAAAARIREARAREIAAGAASAPQVSAAAVGSGTADCPRSHPFAGKSSMAGLVGSGPAFRWGS